MWNGALTIAGVNVPVKVFAATESHTPRFRELHEKDGAPIEHRRVSSKSGREISYDRIVKGYETSAGRYVVLTDEEIKAIEQPERKAIEVEDFVPAEQIDPVYYDRAYFLGAGDEARDAFAALLEALERTGLVGIGRVVLRTKEQLVAIRPGDGVLKMSTMRFADELVDSGDLDVATADRAPSRREVEMAGKLIGGLEEEFDPSAYRDTYRKRVEDYAKAKAKGKAPELEEVPEPEETPDLLEALKASIEGANGRSNGAGKAKRRSKSSANGRRTKAKART
jgi:DNA end-binding protein Ku